MGSKPKAPAPTAQDLELQRRQRTELDQLTRDTNERLKAQQRGRVGRRTLLGGGSELGTAAVRPPGPAGRPGAPGGGGGARGLLGSGGRGGGLGPGSMRIPSNPGRAY